MTRYFAFSVLAVSTLITSCSSDSDDRATGSSLTSPVGTFLDARVGNLQYSINGVQSKTDENGNFFYSAEDLITFSIGDIQFPEIEAKEIITPLDLSSSTIEDSSVINTLRLLQSLDVDGNPENGILIPESAHVASEGLNIEFDSPTFDQDITNFVANSGSQTVTLVEPQAALEHFESSIEKLGSGGRYYEVYGT